MEPFPRYIEIQEDWQYFINAYHILTNKIDRLAEDYSDMLISYGFKEQDKYSGESCNYDFSFGDIELRWEEWDRCGGSTNFSFVLPVEFLLAENPLALMQERVETRARERDKANAQKEKAQQEQATKAQLAAQQAEVEKIRQKMLQDPNFAQALSEIFKKEE